MDNDGYANDLDSIAASDYVAPRPMKEKVKERLVKAKQKFNLLQFIYNVMPMTEWLPKYDFKRNLLMDIISGLTVSSFQIPQGITYGNLLAGQGAQYGLFSSFIPCMVYPLFGSSRFVSIGTYAVICLLVGDYSTEKFPDLPTNATEAQWEELYATRIADVSALTFYMALFACVGSILNVGYVMKYLSMPMMSGFTAGAACHVFSSQVSTLFGVNIERPRGPGKLVKLYISIVKALTVLGPTTWQKVVASLVLGIILLIFLFTTRKLNEWYRVKYFRGIPIPGEFLTLVVGTLLCGLLKFDEKYDMSIVGKIPTGLPDFRAPNFASFGDVVMPIIPILIIGFASHTATAEILAAKHGDVVRANQELLALGAANFMGSLFTCVPAYASISRSCVQEDSGGKSQLAGVIAGAVVILVLLVAAKLFYYTPKVSLATIVLLSVLGMIRKIQDFFKYWKIDKIDAMVWMVSFSTTVFIDVTYGLAISVAFLLLTIVLRTQFDGVKLREVSVDNDSGSSPSFEHLEDVKIVQWNSPLHYLNCDKFKKSVERKADALVPMKYDGSHINMALTEMGEPAPNMLAEKPISMAVKSPSQATTGPVAESGMGSDDGTNTTYSDLPEMQSKRGSVNKSPHGSHSGGMKKPTLILELSVPFTDFTGVTMLSKIIKKQQSAGIDVMLVRVSKNLKDTLKKFVVVTEDKELTKSKVKSIIFHDSRAALVAINSKISFK